LPPAPATAPEKPAKRTRVHVKRPLPPGPDVLLCADEAAAELNIGVSTFWAKLKANQLPPAVYVFPRVPRWRRGALHDFVQNRAKV